MLWRGTPPAHTATHFGARPRTQPRSTCWWRTRAGPPLLLRSYTLCRREQEGLKETFFLSLCLMKTKKTYNPFANSFMRDGKLVNVRMGMRANGSWVRRKWINICYHTIMHVMLRIHHQGIPAAVAVWPACSAARWGSRSCPSGAVCPGRWRPAAWEWWRGSGSTTPERNATSAGSRNPEGEKKTHQSVIFTRKLHLFTTVSVKQTVQGCTWWHFYACNQVFSQCSTSSQSVRLCVCVQGWFLPPPPLTSMTNWPEYVPVMVELWPAARIPTAQM